MFCKKCGARVPDGAKFCGKCGEFLGVSEESSADGRKEFFDGEIHKCPHCGEQIKSFEIICSSCGYELRGVRVSKAISSLIEKLERATSNYQKIQIIKNFPIPNTKEDIFEFMVLATSNFDSAYYAKHLYEEDISDAWFSKIEQCYEKAKISFGTTVEFSEIQTLYDKVIADRQKHIEKEEVREKKVQREKYYEKHKEGFSAVFGLLVAFLCFALVFGLLFGLGGGCNFDPNAIKVGVSNEDLKGQYYEDVIEIFESNGFSNIEAREEKGSIFHKYGIVKKVTINGKESFVSFSKFAKDAKIIIFYYG